MPQAPQHSISAEVNDTRVIRASDHGSDKLVSLQIAGSNGTTGFGSVLSGTPLGKIASSGKFRPCGKSPIASADSAVNTVDVDSAKNFYVADAVDILSTLGVAGSLSITASGAGDVIEVTGRNKDGKTHTFALVDPSAAGASLTKTETFGATGILAVSVSLATSQHAKAFAAEATAKTITVTGKDGKAHTIALVDPSANDAALAVTASFNSGGVGAFVVSLATNGGGAITSTLAQVIAAINGEEIGDYVFASLGTAAGSETAIAVAAQTLAGGGAITSTLAQVIALLNQGDSGEIVYAAIADGDSDAATAIAVASAPLAGGAAVGGTLASNRTITAVDKTSNPNTVTFSGGTVTVAEDDVIQLRDGSQTAVFILDGSVSTYDAEGSMIAQAAVYADRSAAGAWHGLFKAANLTGWNSLILADLGGVSLAGGTYARL